jgi:hypothetical protein
LFRPSIQRLLSSPCHKSLPIHCYIVASWDKKLFNLGVVPCDPLLPLQSNLVVLQRPGSLRPRSALPGGLEAAVLVCYFLLHQHWPLAPGDPGAWSLEVAGQVGCALAGCRSHVARAHGG